MTGKRTDTTTTLKGYPRFAIERRLGAGGMGNVYAARDQERGEIVALKTLHRQDATSLYNFKKEFRTLADVAHPNLVNLYELIADDENCFFTMEWVDGVSFLEYVRPEGEPRGFDPGRLRASLEQLVLGVKALHDANKLHRDLKPSNVMVDATGRVVILDFGVATEAGSQLMPQTVDSGIAGTLAYMAPEQAHGEHSSAASDWYAVGVILFEALTGELPFTGGLSQLLSAKMNGEARSPTEVVPDLPEDLVDLCHRILAREESARPTGREILDLLGASEAELPTGGYTRHERQKIALVGRDREANALAEAFTSTRAGQAVTVYVHGRSGMGKTVLIHSFLERLVVEARAVVLAGRCYERELVPYKALDGLVDSLSKHLLALRPQQVEVLVPRDIRALTRLFPVLQRVDVIARAARRGRESPDQLTRRRRAFAALREMLTRIADRHQLVLYIDDLQWADADSTALLDDLLRPPDSPPLLLLASFRSEELEAKAFLRRLLERTGAEDCREIHVAPLDEQAAGVLAADLLGDGDSVVDVLVDTIVREAEGSPFVIEQLAGYAMTSNSTLSSIVSLSEMLASRIRRLPPGSGALLDTLAVAGRPLSAAVVHRAAGLDGDERPLVATLKNANLLRSSGSAERIEVYHDALREALVERLEEGKIRATHRSLAETLIAQGHDDPEALFEHFRQAGEQEQAAVYAVQAAQKASKALAFDRATLFFRRALDFGRQGDEERFELTHGLAEALANAGRPAEAAEAFLAAAILHSGPEALDCRRRAAQEYLAGGYFEEGTRLIRSVLEAIGMKVPQNRVHALLSLLWQRLRLRLRGGLEYTLRSAEDLSHGALRRIDTCWAIASSLITVEPLQGLDFQTRHLRFALEAGEPLRLARALAIELSFRAQRGSRSGDEILELRKSSRELAQRMDDPYVTGITTLHSGLSAYLVGAWQRGADQCDEADIIFTDQCKGVLWDQTTARRYALACLLYMGEMAEVERRVARQLVAAEERGNQLGTTDLRTRLNMTWLAGDDPERAHREVDLALRGRDGFHLVHYNGFWARNQADLYAGDFEAARQRLDEVWPRLARSPLMRIQILKMEAHSIRGRTSLAAQVLRKGSDPAQIVRNSAAVIAAGNLPYTTTLSNLLLAGLAASEGRDEQTAALLRQSLKDAQAAQMHLHAAAARRQLGTLLGGEEGKAHINEADAWMQKQRIARPERMTAMLIPGFGERPA